MSRLQKQWVVICGLVMISIVLAMAARPALSASRATGSDQVATATPEKTYQGKLPSIAFPTSADWINVAKPLTMDDLRGKVVLLDFWTYGCINCIHILPDLKRLESESGGALAVIGVHSAKFSAESQTANIRSIVQRYQVDHPVINDNQFTLWHGYGIQAWPTVLVIDPVGKVLGNYAGEGVYDGLHHILEAMIRQFDARKLIDRTPLPVVFDQTAPGSLLLFPGEVLADAAGGRLFISDTDHNRIIVADLKTYAISAVIGSGALGLDDGTFTGATFYHPQGVALSSDGNILYVADTENHAIRAVELGGTARVKTIAGTGAEAMDQVPGQPDPTPKPGLKTALNSPWALVAVADTLYIAMAGAHQLWALDLKAGTVRPFAGSGEEGLEDAPLLQAQLAQPSAITSDGKTLYFTDPEASAVRTADLDAGGAVHTLVGTGLFDFGDVDGVGDTVRLQHALGIALASDGKLYVADTYNSKIKRIDPATRTSTTLFGHTDRGLRDGADPLFNEPGGLSYADGKLYVADTNNHAIRVIDLASGVTSTVVFPNAEVLAVDVAPTFNGAVIALPPQSVAAGDGHLIVNISVPSGFRLNDTAPFTLHVYPAKDVFTAPPDFSAVQPTMPLSLPITLSAGQADLTADANVYYCDAVNEKLCYVAQLRLTIPLTVTANGGGNSDVVLTYTIAPSVVPKNTLAG